MCDYLYVSQGFSGVHLGLALGRGLSLGEERKMGESQVRQYDEAAAGVVLTRLTYSLPSGSESVPGKSYSWKSLFGALFLHEEDVLCHF